jgi:digeranylgeranylglycerophospholipid reductase
MRSDYDVIVVGAGPGGSWAAKAAAEKGAKVLMLEKDREVGTPVRCGEAIGAAGLAAVCEPDPIPPERGLRRGIASEISGAVLVAPNGREVVLEFSPSAGYVLDRKVFDFELALMAAAKGVEVRTKAYVYDVIRNGAVNGVRVQQLGKNYDVTAKIVIGADGIESRVGRFAGLRTFTKLKDMESCMQVTLANVRVDPHYIYLFFGQDVAPGGYLWIFPKSETVANVGLGISGDFARHKSAQRYLQEFIDRRFPKAAAVYTVVGGVSCAPTLTKIVADGLMLVGDAAHQINPMTGGGIVTAMLAGKIAGRVAAEAIASGDVSGKNLAPYPKEWHEAQGKNHERIYKIKQAVYKFTDDELNRTAEAVLARKPEERTLVNVFKAALVRHPSLIFDLLKVFMS